MAGGNGGDSFTSGGAGGQSYALQPGMAGSTGRYSTGGGGGGAGSSGGNGAPGSGAFGGVGGTAGLGATSAGGTGGAGGAGTGPGGATGGGGGGGGGATDLIVYSDTTVAQSATGGGGGRGGDATAGRVGGGGGGGAGAFGVAISGTGYSVTIQQGLGAYGGKGGAGGNVNYGVGTAGASGSGGSGGGGLFAGAGNTVVNDGKIYGGNGGAAGQNYASPGYAGSAGAGGAGIVGSNLTVVNTTGTISGGMSGDTTPVQADAIDFTGGTQNSLTLGGTLNGGLGITGALTLVAAAPATLSNLIHDASGGPGALVYDSSSELTLSGDNSYSGGTTIEAGTLSVSADDNLGAGTGGLTLAGGTLDVTQSFSSSRDVTLGGLSSTIDTEGGVELTLNGNISAADSSVQILYKVGDGTLLLNGQSTYTGGTYVKNGTLEAGADGVLSAASSYHLKTSSSVLDLGGFSETVSSIVLNGGSLQNGTLAGNSSIASSSNGGTISGIGGSFHGIYVNGGTVDFSDDTYSARTIIGDTINPTPTALALGKDAFSAASVTSIGSNGVLDLGGYDQTIDTIKDDGTATGIITNSGPTEAMLTTGGTVTSSFAGTIEDGAGGGALALFKTGSAKFTLSGTNTYSGGTTIEAGTLALDHATGGAIDAVSNGAIAIDDATLLLDLGGTLGNEIDLGAGTRSVIAAAKGFTATLTGALQPSTTPGRLAFGSASHTGTVVLDGQATGDPLGLLAVYGGALQAGAGNNELGDLTLGAARTLIGAVGTLDFDGNEGEIANLAGAGTLTNALGATTTIDAGSFAGRLAGGGNVQIAGSVTLSGASTLTGTIAVDQGARLSLTATASFAAAAGITDNGQLHLAGTTIATRVNGTGGVYHTGTLAGDGSGGHLAFVANKRGTLTFTGDGDRFAGTLGGNGSIVLAAGSDAFKAGLELSSAKLSLDGADLTLDAAQSYGGAFTADAGTLDLSGKKFSLTGSTVLDGATIEGGGNLVNAGAMSLRDDAALSTHLGNHGKLTQRADLVFGARGYLSNLAGATDTLLGDFDITSARKTVNAGLLTKTAGRGTSTISGNVGNTGTVEVASGKLDLAGNVGGTGMLAIEGNSTLELGAVIAAGQTVAFGAGQADGTLKLDSANAFHGAISGFDAGDRIGLAGFDDHARILYEAATSGSGGTLKVIEAGHHFTAHLDGTYQQSGFGLTPSATGATLHYKA